MDGAEVIAKVDNYAKIIVRKALEIEFNQRNIKKY